MTGPTPYVIDPREGPESRADILGHRDAGVRMIARAMTAGVSAAMEQWVVSEMRRGVDAVEILDALIAMQNSHIASLLAQCFSSSGDQPVAELVAKRSMRDIPAFAAAIRGRLADGRDA